MKMLFRLLRSVLVVLVVLVVAASAGSYLWLRGALPQTTGTVTVQGLSAPVEILREASGIPHIRATSENDALFGLGYAHAQDRLWQMEFQRRIAYGRLSEVLGEATLTEDRFLRTLGPGRAADAAWRTISATGRDRINAYVAGVNAFIDSHHGNQLPIEFSLLGVTPEHWRPEEVLAWGKMMSWNLSGNWEQELLRAQLNQKFDPAAINALLPGYLPDGPLILPDGGAVAAQPASARPTSSGAATCHQASSCAELLAFGRTIEQRLGLGGQHIGSNNWVIGGSRTSTGMPLLANDPHLGSQIPSIWYLAHLQGGQLDVIGATLPGVAGVVIGRNQHIAWGVTNTGPDVQDLFLERINDQDQAEYNGQLEPLQIINEVIKVKGQPDITLRVRISRHGPIISDVLEGATEPMAFRWTALDEQDRTFEAFLNLNLASNWQEFTKALQVYHTPMQNFVYADVAGNIGYYAPGALPMRASGDGSAPVPGWTDAHEWQGYVPFEQLPHTYNPPEGFIVTANNKVTPDSYPHLISTTWAAPYRAERIRELITATSSVTPNDIAAMQGDVISTHARRLLPLLLAAQPASTRGQAAIALLQGWNGEIAGPSAQAALFEAWRYAIPRQVFGDELGDELYDQYAEFDDEYSMALEQLLPTPNNRWCDDIATPSQEDCPTILGQALERALDDMGRAQGSDDPRSWRWDRAHQVVFPHQVFENVAQLRPIFSRRLPNGGDDYTVNIGPINREDPYNQRNVPSYRQILDLSDPDGSRFIHTTGQSGYVFSPHYDDLLERWQRVEYMPVAFSSAAVETNVRDRLTLTPAR